MKAIACAAIRALVTAGVLAGVPLRAAADCRLERGSAHVVTKVIDGETLALDDGSEVRLIGALAPRTGEIAAMEGAWTSEREARAALENLTAGKTARLKFGGERKDRYGRWLAHVFVTNTDGGETWVQQRLLTEGHARAYVIQGNRACGNELMAAEAPARAAGRGLWAVPTYRVRDGAWPRELGLMLGSFRVISGVVRHVSQRREGYRIWLNAQGRRGDVSIAVRSNDRELIGGLGGDLRALVGKRIEVRGWIDQRRGAGGGPEIDLSVAGMMTVIAQE